jgi:uncharacterized damage-inducible protein DinB
MQAKDALARRGHPLRKPQLVWMEPDAHKSYYRFTGNGRAEGSESKRGCSRLIKTNVIWWDTLFMPSKQSCFASLVLILTATTMPAFAQGDVKAILLKHLKTSRDFSLKVADQMPESTYDFKLTPPQMSFAEQMVHLSQSLAVYISPFSGQEPKPAKPASMRKKDVLAFMTKSFDDAMAQVSKVTPEQLSKTYQSEEGAMTGLELIIAMLDHNTHHRASAEMYLRAKGIKPAEYQF